MPRFGAVQAEVHADGKPLEEYGTQRPTGKNIVSTWIEARTDKIFSVMIQPDLPWNYSEATNSSDTQVYCLMAEIFFDGRAEAERRSIVHLDTHHPDAREDGRLWIKHRWIKAADGQLEEYHFVFKEKGVENIFREGYPNSQGAGYHLDRPLLKRVTNVYNLLRGLRLSATAGEQDDEGDLTQSVLSTKLFDNDNKAMSKSSPGKIVIKLHRVKISTSFVDYNYGSRIQASNDEDGVSSDDRLTHTATSVSTGITVPNPQRVVEITRYKQELGPYAVFIFHYRTRNQLSRMGLQGFPHSPARRSRSCTTLFKYSPLNLLQRQTEVASKEASMFKAKQNNEERVQRQSFKPYSDETLSFSQEYRSLKKGKGRRRSAANDDDNTTTSSTNTASRSQELSLLRPSMETASSAQPVDAASLTPGNQRRSERVRKKSGQVLDVSKHSHESSGGVGHSMQDFRHQDAESDGDEEESLNDTDAEARNEVEESDSYGVNPEEGTYMHCQLRGNLEKVAIRKRPRDDFEIAETENDIPEGGDSTHIDSASARSSPRKRISGKSPRSARKRQKTHR